MNINYVNFCAFVQNQDHSKKNPVDKLVVEALKTEGLNITLLPSEIINVTDISIGRKIAIDILGSIRVKSRMKMYGEKIGEMYKTSTPWTVERVSNQKLLEKRCYINSDVETISDPIARVGATILASIGGCDLSPEKMYELIKICYSHSKLSL